MTLPRAIAAFVLLSAVNLALMVPGGIVETRSFPDYDVAVLAAFNIFLTVLGLGSLILGYRILRRGRAGVTPLLAGLGYVAVYVLDLAEIFPVSAEPMSRALYTMEWIGTLLGAVLVVLSGWQIARGGETGIARPALSVPMMIGLGAVMLVIVVFATWSAM
ncbi:hypothetical protein [Pararhodobacter marinus]|uniref:hypothetical protein n=1 Tax=Pararhodobacter marinus TaxID=2184063 RepID=UPI003516C4B8